MENSGIESLVDLIERIEINEENREQIKEIKKFIEEENYVEAIKLLKKLKSEEKIKLKEIKEPKEKVFEEEFIPEDEESEENEQIYPKRLLNKKLEEKYIGLLLENPKAISMYYILHEDCYFQSEEMLNIYKSVLFTEGQAYAPQIAKNEFNFAKEGTETYKRKVELREEAQKEKYDFEKTYVELRKLFEIRKNYLSNPIKEIQEEIINILDYELYDQMTIQEVKDAIVQITTTEKFKRAVLSRNITNFLLAGDNSLTTGLELPFPILSEVFKGIRKGETMAYAMPSNSGKSRFTINIATYLAFIHHKKVLIISNEMSEDKMKLCLITTVLNNKEIQKLHGQKLSKTEGELLEFKFRPDKGVSAKVDEEGFVVKEENETQKEFTKRLLEISSEFRNTIKVTEWIDEQLKNSIYFVNITNHTNDELEKVILNYYYKEKIEYMFYDTLKTDTENIGNGEELKKTATILSNLAQNLNIFIASSLQLTESSTLPINLNINDLAVSRTVKEVLDTLCLIKQIHNEDLNKYEYSLEEVDTKFFDLKKYKDPDVRYYACVVDKNRAGAKPKVVFRLNLAYNMWEELGYLRLKSSEENE
jgi:dnaB-like helicase C terminal domain